MTWLGLLALPLLISMSGARGPDTYNLVVDGVDDQLDCELNGLPVAHYTFGQSGVTALKPKPGHNVFICRPRDLGQRAGHACWAFKYRLFRNWDELLHVYSSCCSRDCPAQPAPVRTDFEAK